MNACLGGDIPESIFSVYFASKVPFPKVIKYLLSNITIMVRNVYSIRRHILGECFLGTVPRLLI